MADSPEATSAGQVDESTTNDADTQDSSDAPDVNPDDLRAAVETAGGQAALQAELTALKRATGHVPGIQKRLDSLERDLGTKLESLTQAVARFDSLLEAIPEDMISDRDRARLRAQPGDSNSEVMSKLSELEQRLTADGKQDDPEVDVQREQVIAQWAAATNSVKAYAVKNGVEIADNDPAWERAYRAFPNDPTAAALEVVNHVKEEVAARGRRAEKKDAGSGNVQGARTTRDAELTWDEMGRMSRTELAKIPREVREAAQAKAAAFA